MSTEAPCPFGPSKYRTLHSGVSAQRKWRAGAAWRESGYPAVGMLCLSPKKITHMKNQFIAHFIISSALAASAWAADAPASAPPSNGTVSGVILEIKEVDSYSYLRLKTKDGEIWAAVTKAPVKKGATVTITDVMVMKNFESKSLKKTFPSIIFGNVAGNSKSAADPHANAVKVVDTTPIKVTKATGANARTVAEVIAKSVEFKDRSVQIRGKIVKYSPGIMGKNWIHLRDGTGSESDNTNDLLVTTTGQAKLGDVVTVTGTVRVDKDFGAGYVYKVLVEDATVAP
jgi:hypothetical protein